MKVFISHSSVDKWAARRISEDLVARGAETFLDEKDIDTGDDISASIQSNLNSCDDCMIILSPSSVESAWVLVELGGAIALGKRVVPILLHVGSNSIPSPISMKLARDINDIDKYYDEVLSRLKGVEAGHQKIVRDHQPKPIKRSIEVGDRVTVVSQRPDLTPDMHMLGWNPDMDKYLGVDAIVTKQAEDGFYQAEGEVFNIDADSGEFYWHERWLRPIVSK